jgi:transposase
MSPPSVSKATEEEHPMRGPRFDPTVNLGHMLSAGVFLLSAGAAWMNMDARVTRAESAIFELKQRDAEQAKDVKDAVVTVENRFMREVTTQRAHMDQTQVRVADDIREIKTLIRDGFRDFDAKLDRKVDKQGR